MREEAAAVAAVAVDVAKASPAGPGASAPGAPVTEEGRPCGDAVAEEGADVEGQGRQRDLLPLPSGDDAVRALQMLGLLPHCGSLKRAKRLLTSEDRWLLGGIDALNALGGSGLRFRKGSTPSGGQLAALRRLHRQ